MQAGSLELLATALRRSIWLIGLLTLVGAYGYFALRQHQGREYQASARVLLSTTDLGAALTGTQPAFVDPARLDRDELTLASSPQLFDRAAASVGGRLGSGSDLRAITNTSGGSTKVAFTATGSSASRVIDTVNALATTYPLWRAAVTGATIETAVKGLQQQIRRTGATTVLQDQLQKLRVLK